MINTLKIKRILALSFAVAVITVLSGSAFEASAQRDPFAKPGWARAKEPGKGGTRTDAQGKPINGFVPGIPSIEQRIEYYKRQREEAASTGRPLPKVTSVLALSEMQVTGIFRTPRGYAAMVEATPIRLSYTIYPGERFFDGQLVAVEENRLVFRKVTKVGKDKFATTVENKPLRKYTQRELIQGTAPAGAETASAQPAPQTPPGVEAVAMPAIVSPLDEMNQASPDTEPSKGSKKPVRTARNN